MDIQKTKASSLLFRIKAKDAAGQVQGGVITKGRFLIGRSESCDVVVDNDSISAVHAVLEVFDEHARIYDMNSTNGTWINGKKVVTGELRPGDSFALADVALSLLAYRPDQDLPPVLDTLEPAHGKASVSVPPLPQGEAKAPPKAPSVSPGDVPYVVYPLASDPRAEASEYIFEDVETLYPIFKYEPSKQAVEVIVLFRDRVFSVDYLPENGQYGLAGFGANATELEFPYLGRNERIPFIDSRGTEVSVHKISGFDILHLSENQPKAVNQGGGMVELRHQDILRFHSGLLQIFVRRVDAPPQVAAAPLLRRDPVLRFWLFVCFLATLTFSLATFLITFDEEKKEEELKELAPERVATILYRQKLVVSKEKAVAKTPNTPKVAQKAPPKPIQEDKPAEKPPEVKPKVRNSDRDTNQQQGSKTAKETRPVRKGNPNSNVQAEGRIGGPAAGPKTGEIKVGSSKSAFQGVKASGPVEVYKSADFSSSVSSIMAKGGTLASSSVGVKAAGSGGSNTFGDGVATGTGSGSSLQKAAVANSMGSLTGAADGVIGRESKGAEGLSSKTTIFTAGIPAETVVLGSMDPDVIRRILMDNLPKFRYCYQSELERAGREVQGVIKLNFVIGASGHVAQAGVEDATNLPATVKRCVVNVLRGIQFPEPMGGGTVEVKQPMNFYPKKT